MKAKPMFRVVGASPDSEPVLILQQSTRQGAELVLRLIQYASPFSELRIEGGPDSQTYEMAESPPLPPDRRMPPASESMWS
jgi:hypothetical protein